MIAHPSSGVARVAFLRRIPVLLDEFGVDPEAVLAAVGLTRTDLKNPEGELPYSLLERLLIECERRTGCEHFGLRVSEQTHLDDVGTPGRAARCGSTVGAGLRELVGLYNLRRGGGLIDLVDTGQHASLIFAMATVGTRDTRQYQMGAVAILRNVLEDLCGPAWRSESIRFAFRSPTNPRPFQQFFRAALQFDAEDTAVVFDSAWLKRPLPGVDVAFRRSVAAEVEALRTRAFEDFPGLVRDIVRRQLLRGPCSMATVSAMLSMHRRTLDRRLADFGQSFGTLRGSVLRELAQQLLRETDLSVQEIGDFLRFSSAANFATAFRRWSGRTPSQFRADGSNPRARW